MFATTVYDRFAKSFQPGVEKRKIASTLSAGISAVKTKAEGKKTTTND
jgi:hypothetical protein